MTPASADRHSDTRPLRSPEGAEPDSATGAVLINAAEAAGLPTSFGVFKPVGHVMMGLPSQAQLDALVTALHRAGWLTPAVRQFSPRETVDELRAMVGNAGPLAGFGYEITLLQRYLALAEKGYLWLLVQADDGERAAAAADIARTCGATLAVYYRMLTEEELIS
jgi:hypothetical protein